MCADSIPKIFYFDKCRGASVVSLLHMLGIAPREFLRRHWQKRPLFVRAALPQFAVAIDARTLGVLAARDDVESRIVERRGARYTTTHGPFRKIKAGKANWTLLVSGVNLHVPAAEALLRRFAFIPQARLDDVMVSFAAPGGGVGPHVDSYDVFLLQGPGVRRWKVWNPGGNEQTFVSSPGDLLYLPPGWRHHGVALQRCFTFSIGFRAPGGRELGAAFLDWLHERGLPDATYRDANLRPGRPASIPPGMIAFAERVLARIDWKSGEVRRFLGEYLSMPKPHVVFARGRARVPLTRARVRLDAKTQLLYSGGWFFLNGESFTLPARQSRALRELADKRHIRGSHLAGSPLASHIVQWHRSGYLHVERA
jgi:50S ribosomal protein L16 3-hydroxylase